MNDIQLTAIVVGITGIVRTRLPKIDGSVVPGIAMAVGATLSALANPTAWREALVHGIGVALAAVGGMTAIGYAGTKFGTALGADSSAPPPAPPT